MESLTQSFSSLKVKEVKEVKERKLIIFDLNGVLIDRQYNKDRSYKPKIAGSSQIGHFLAWRRPRLDRLLNTVFEEYDVALWSSVSTWNIEQFGKYAFGKHWKQLKFVFSQKECEAVPGLTKDRPLFLKNLATVWEKYPQYTQDNTLLVDDSAEKSRNNPAQSHLTVKKWLRTDSEDNDSMFLLAEIRACTQKTE